MESLQRRLGGKTHQRLKTVLVKFDKKAKSIYDIPAVSLTNNPNNTAFRLHVARQITQLTHKPNRKEAIWPRNKH